MAKAKTRTQTKTKRGSGKRTRRVRDTKRAITTGVRVPAVVRGPKQKQNTGRPRKKAQRGVRAHATAAVPERRGRRRQPEGRAVGAGPSAERRQPAESGRARGGQRALAAAPKGGSRRVREAGPSLPLRDLVRGGMPRSPKAGQGQRADSRHRGSRAA